MKIKIAKEDTFWDVEKPIYRKWWQIWKPKVIGTYIFKELIHKKGDKYFDAEGKSISEIYDEIQGVLRQEENAT